MFVGGGQKKITPPDLDIQKLLVGTFHFLSMTVEWNKPQSLLIQAGGCTILQIVCSPQSQEQYFKIDPHWNPPLPPPTPPNLSPKFSLKWKISGNRYKSPTILYFCSFPIPTPNKLMFRLFNYTQTHTHLLAVQLYFTPHLPRLSVTVEISCVSEYVCWCSTLHLHNQTTRDCGVSPSPLACGQLRVKFFFCGTTVEQQ